jgi:hypothetical protein
MANDCFFKACFISVGFISVDVILVDLECRSNQGQFIWFERKGSNARVRPQGFERKGSTARVRTQGFDRKGSTTRVEWTPIDLAEYPFEPIGMLLKDI